MVPIRGVELVSHRAAHFGRRPDGGRLEDVERIRHGHDRGGEVAMFQGIDGSVPAPRFDTVSHGFLTVSSAEN
jgi:hypothetical protein